MVDGKASHKHAGMMEQADMPDGSIPLTLTIHTHYQYEDGKLSADEFLEKLFSSEEANRRWRQIVEKTPNPIRKNLKKQPDEIERKGFS